MKLKRYTVTGIGVFPLDMLRYDCAWPADDNAVCNVFVDEETGYRSPRTVTLLSYNLPTDARWASFGWKVNYPHI